MQREFVKLLAAGLIFCAASGCNTQERADQQQPRPSFSYEQEHCFGPHAGYGVALCSVSFERLVSQPEIFHNRFVALKATLSLEFGACVLHRDNFAAENYLDLESVAIDDPRCSSRAKEILKSGSVHLVSIVGRYEKAGMVGNTLRAGKLTDIRVLEPEIVVRR